MGADEPPLAEALLGLEGVCSELVKTLHPVKAAPETLWHDEACRRHEFVAHPCNELSSLHTPSSKGLQTLTTGLPVGLNEGGIVGAGECRT